MTKLKAGEAARVTRSDWARMARRAAQQMQKARDEKNRRLELEGKQAEWNEKLYVLCTFEPRASDPWTAKVISGLGEAENELIGDALAAKGRTPEQAANRLHTVYMFALSRARIMRHEDARRRARSVEFVIVDKMKEGA